MNRITTTTLAIALTAGLASSAAAQSDPSTFSTVFNIGTVSPGSIFDITDADIPGTLITGNQIGDGNDFFGENVVTPTFLGGDTLGSDSQLNLLDGSEILFGFEAGPFTQPGSNVEVNITGGTVGGFFTASSGTTVNISGGSVGDHFEADFESTVNLFGTSFFLDGVELTNLAFGTAFTIDARDVSLTGLLADGSAFDFDLNTSDSVLVGDIFEVGATLTVTLVPMPGSAGVLAIGGLFAARRRR